MSDLNIKTSLADYGLTEEDAQNIEAKAARSASDSYKLKYDLVKLRIKQGLTVEDISERTGISPKKVRKFEKYWTEPNLSIIRRYALAVGAAVAISVITDYTPEDHDIYKKQQDKLRVEEIEKNQQK
jgi:transcriptional regulator with XRE-family HTH domain